MQQLNFHGKDKATLAIEFIREHEPPEGYFLGFSGGKDSTVLYDLTKKSGVKFQAYYSATGIDAPEVVKFIREKYPEVIWLHPSWHGHKSLFGMIPTRGFPTKWRRWCCDALKKEPTKRIKLTHRLMGLRAEESTKRANAGWITKYKGWTIYRPIFDWLEWEIWDYIDLNELPYCSLYDEGFSRLGCVVCPFISGRKALEVHKARWPKIYHAFEKSMLKYWYKGKKDGSPFKESTFEEFLSNWYKGK